MSLFKNNDIVEHRNGNAYLVFAVPPTFKLEANAEPGYAYRGLKEGDEWGRCQEEMEDGRFEKIGHRDTDSETLKKGIMSGLTFVIGLLVALVFAGWIIENLYASREPYTLVEHIKSICEFIKALRIW